MRRLAIWAAVLLAALAAAGFAGALHPAGDSLAVFRGPLLALALLFWLLAWRARWLRFGGAAVLAGALGLHAMAGWKLQAAPDLDFTLYQKNLSYDLADPAPLLADIERQKPDFITLQEVSAGNGAVLEALAKDYPSQWRCAFSHGGGVAVLSRHPLIEGQTRCAENDGLAAMRLSTPRGPLWLVSLHLRWPWPFGQAAQIDRLVPVLRALDGPVLIGGDFNMVAWGDALRRIGAASGTRRVGHVATTFNLPRIGLGIGIDHVLSSGDAAQEVFVRPQYGSDHKGVLARVDPGAG